MNTQENYRLIAAERIKNTPELGGLRHILKKSWCSNDFCKRIATESYDQLVLDSELFSPSGLKVTAYHEAAHAVVHCLVGINFKHVTIVPVEGKLGHVERSENEIEVKGLAYVLWRCALILAVGPIAEVKVSHQFPYGYDTDFEGIIIMLQKITPGADLEPWLKTIVDVAKMMVENRMIWASIEWVANLLMEQGTATFTQIKKHIDKAFGKYEYKPAVIACLYAMGQACDVVFKAEDCKGADVANNTFLQELNRLIDDLSLDKVLLHPFRSEDVYFQYLLENILPPNIALSSL